VRGARRAPDEIGRPGVLGEPAAALGVALPAPAERAVVVGHNPRASRTSRASRRPGGGRPRRHHASRRPCRPAFASTAFATMAFTNGAGASRRRAVPGRTFHAWRRRRPVTAVALTRVPKGTLVAMGGAEDKVGRREVLARFVELGRRLACPPRRVRGPRPRSGRRRSGGTTRCSARSGSPTWSP
jgi:hypothetical protein